MEQGRPTTGSRAGENRPNTVSSSRTHRPRPSTCPGVDLYSPTRDISIYKNDYKLFLLPRGSESGEPNFYSLNQDNREWNRKGFSFGKQERGFGGTVRPSPCSTEADYCSERGQMSNMARMSMLSPMRYAASVRSKTAQRPHLNTPSTPARVGPGLYSLRATKDTVGAPKDPEHKSSPFSDKTKRTEYKTQSGEPTFYTVDDDMKNWQRKGYSSKRWNMSGPTFSHAPRFKEVKKPDERKFVDIWDWTPKKYTKKCQAPSINNTAKQGWKPKPGLGLVNGEGVSGRSIKT